MENEENVIPNEEPVNAELAALRRENEELKSQLQAIADKERQDRIEAARAIAQKKLPTGVLYEDAPVFKLIEAMPEDFIAFMSDYPEHVTTAKITPDDVDEDADNVEENPYFKEV